ncbi:MAG: sulfatase-like hydrolase/transferase [Caldilineaceae bacterium SB0670_bin_27]|uniref:Sulfatase-like hydrolase/transferase n=1 Tax=Caldilineaceae bacterium SB0664_bin_27 TaxID=2605260 RepID=A0A6B0YMI6_9CHLR|nr:sulfatase-like hydrolase/transferase [Caldilineaceae bacterium SB0664_bin_27]MYJ79907.1 sulfatase-like hydrolase/transferase [Caldilineaceae bacterium SB0670_bin_27]
MSESNGPNLLYIHSDQHCPHVTGCYGDDLVDTPNLDRLAANGVVFDNAYCNSPICVPSRMSMLSGRHPFQNEVWTNEHALESRIPTIAHAMGAAGYQPELVGRMHALGPDQLHGYAARFVGDHGANHPGNPGPDRGILGVTAGPHHLSLKRSGAGQSAYQVHDEEVTAVTIDRLNRFGVQKRAGLLKQPFSLSVGYILPHPPYVARQEDYERYADSMTLPRKAAPPVAEQHPFLRWWRESTGITVMDEDEVRRARAAYAGLVYRTDAMVGQILDALEENGLDDNTLIIYTSDHGDMQGEHGLFWKHVFYEESIRVPLIMSWPGRIPPQQRFERVVSAVDVAATMLDAMEAPELPNAAGRSFLSQIDGGREAAGWDDLAFSEYCTDKFGPPEGAYQRMLRREEWKYIYYHEMPAQLFNLKEDPEELVDRSEDPGCQTVVQEMQDEVLRDWDPEQVRRKMAQKRADEPLLTAWARNTGPEERYRWPMLKEMNWLA